MPFFSRNPEPVEQPAPQPINEERGKRHGLFGSRHQEPVNEPTPVAQPVQEKRHGLFGRRSPSPTPSNVTRNTVSSDASTTSGHRSSILHRSFGNGSLSEVDPSIVQARERVMSAEAAERDADRALLAARESVRQASEHVRRLELEAEEEARRAKIKQYQAREVSKRGKQLGRHGV
ncbi:hypothetical protein B0T25DRAFT_586144 [Lasiosphaeria hispida]|uniref:Uncharacterized protein n=1 Tax=Lasiosphaeria hispida TaxID=260671 RepID=A0AAJ0H846_9PEZI|nr:hypothetical protein B0T25DRAFT_586144 [Lasiosphaeria hispida]